MKVITFSFFFMTSLIYLSCSIQNMDASSGIIWQRDLSSPPSAGIEVHSNNLFFADSTGGIYSCWAYTGQLNWKRNLGKEKIIMLFPMEPGIGVISAVPDLRGCKFRIYSYDTGIISFETNLSIKPRDTYSIYGTDVLVHSSNAVLILGGERERKIRIIDFSRFSHKIATFARWGNYFYLIDSNSKIFRFGSYMLPSGPHYSLGGKFAGDAAYDGTRIYIATSEGLKLINTLTWSLESAATVFKNSSFPSRIIFSEKTNYFIYSDMSFKILSDNYTPIILSEPLDITSFLDSRGALEIIDNRTGSYLGSRFFGTIDRPFLKTAKDYTSKSIFIPLSSPAKIFCYSLKFAVSQKMPR